MTQVGISGESSDAEQKRNDYDEEISFLKKKFSIHEKSLYQASIDVEKLHKEYLKKKVL